MILTLERIARGYGALFCAAELGVAQGALVLVEVVFTAPRALFIFELRVAEKATILIAFVLLAPQASRLPQGGIAEEALSHWRVVPGAERNVCNRGRLVAVRRRGRLSRTRQSEETDRQDYPGCRNDSGRCCVRHIVPLRLRVVCGKRLKRLSNQPLQLSNGQAVIPALVNRNNPAKMRYRCRINAFQ